jgi:hypothetical protein
MVGSEEELGRSRVVEQSLHLALDALSRAVVLLQVDRLEPEEQRLRIIEGVRGTSISSFASKRGRADVRPRGRKRRR